MIDRPAPSPTPPPPDLEDRPAMHSPSPTPTTDPDPAAAAAAASKAGQAGQPDPADAPPSQPEPQSAVLPNLPDDMLTTILSHLRQPDLAVLSSSCRALHTATGPFLSRMYRCSSCQHALFRPRDLSLPVPTGRHRPEFFELAHAPLSPPVAARADPATARAGDGDGDGDGATDNGNGCDDDNDDDNDNDEGETPSYGLALDEHRGAPNFHVLRQLARTEYRDHAAPLRRDDVRAVRALRCPACGVFVGFRHDGGGTARDYIHRDFVELVDASARPVSLSGDVLPAREGVVRCRGSGCATATDGGAILFARDDVLPWAHVLASSRLTDFDAYLEWDHSWAGAATAAQPAFFVKRLRPGAVVVENAREERLRQGDMTVGDVRCARCGSHIGWKFLAELPMPDGAGEGQALLRNYDQVGRYGIIRSAVTPSEPRYRSAATT